MSLLFPALDLATGGRVLLSPTGALQFVLNGNGSAIATGLKPFHVRVPHPCQIVAATLTGPDGESGGFACDPWKASDETTVPTNSESIAASAPPTISSGRYSRDTTLTGWSTTLATGNVIWLNVDSNAGGFTYMQVLLETLRIS